MNNTGESVFFSAADLTRIMEERDKLRDAEKRKAKEQADAARRAELAELRKPVVVTAEQVARALRRMKTAAESGQHELVVFTFPAELCEDGGRTINNSLPGWPDTLVGVPRAIYEAWEQHLKDKGFRLHARVTNYTEDGRVGDVAMVILW